MITPSQRLWIETAPPEDLIHYLLLAKDDDPLMEGDALITKIVEVLYSNPEKFADIFAGVVKEIIRSKREAHN